MKFIDVMDEKKKTKLIQNYDQAYALALFLAKEKSRHYADIRTIDVDLALLRQKWGVIVTDQDPELWWEI